MRNLTLALLMFLILAGGCRGSGLGGSGYSYNAATKRYEIHEQRRRHRAGHSVGQMETPNRERPPQEEAREESSGLTPGKVAAGAALLVGYVVLRTAVEVLKDTR